MVQFWANESWVHQDNDQVISIPLWCNFGALKTAKKNAGYQHESLKYRTIFM